MVATQRHFKIGEQVYLMDSSNRILHPPLRDFKLKYTFRNEEFNYTIFGYCDFMHMRQGTWTCEASMVDSSFELDWFSQRTGGTYSGSTAGVAFEEMYRATVEAGPQLNLPYTPVSGAAQLFDYTNREDYEYGTVAADPNTYSVAGNVVSMPPSTALGSLFQVNYFRTTATAAKSMFDPYTIPGLFTLYAAQLIYWEATGEKYWYVLYARQVAPTGEISLTGGDQTLNFRLNNTVPDSVIVYRTQVNE